MIPFRRALLCAAAAALAAAACGTESPVGLATPASVPGNAESGAPTPLTPLVQLDIPTYEGSNQVVHPDVVRFAAPWSGWEYWMAVTPFPGGREVFENPSILVSHDGLRWQVPDGATNPLAQTPPRQGYNSDPDLSYDPARDRLVLIYREVSATHNLIHSTSSSDGVHWLRPRLVFARKNHGIVSPTVSISPDGKPTVWYVDAGPKKCAERTTRVTMQRAGNLEALRPMTPDQGWSTPSRSGLVQPGHNIWHIDVTWVPERNEYWAVYIAYPGYECWGQDLYFARSSDGMNWTTYNAPFLLHGANPWTASTLYRASVLYDASRDVIQFFVSGESRDHAWHVGYLDYQLHPFLASLEHEAAPATSAATAHGASLADLSIEP